MFVIIKGKGMRDPMAIQAKFKEWYRLKEEKGINFNDKLLNSREFCNPNITTKLVEYAKIDEFGTNFLKSQDVLDINELLKEFNYEEIAKKQRSDWEGRCSKQRRPLEFVSSGSRGLVETRNILPPQNNPK